MRQPPRMSSVTPAAAPGSWPAPQHRRLCGVWWCAGDADGEAVRLDATSHETHLYHGIQNSKVTTYVPLEWSGVTTFLCIPVDRSSSRLPCAPAVRGLAGGPGPPWPRRCCAAPRIPHGPESPTPQRPMQRPSARLHPNHRGPSRPVTPVTRHTTNADTFHIVHASPAVHSLTRHHTYSW